MLLREIVVGISLVSIAVAIVYFMWMEEYRYSLPTPVPEDFEMVPIGSCLKNIPLNKEPHRATFLHFFNPNCPCSRFNIKHFQHLVKTFGEQVSFYIIIPVGSSREKTRRLIDLELPIIEDHNGQWAKMCGVYATPQAVIIQADGRLYFRGNYNKARFCTIPGDNYAEISLNMFLQGKPSPHWNPLATTAYGCEFSYPNHDSSLTQFQPMETFEELFLWNKAISR